VTRPAGFGSETAAPGARDDVVLGRDRWRRRAGLLLLAAVGLVACSPKLKTEADLTPSLRAAVRIVSAPFARNIAHACATGTTIRNPFLERLKLLNPEADALSLATARTYVVPAAMWQQQRILLDVVEVQVRQRLTTTQMGEVEQFLERPDMVEVVGKWPETERAKALAALAPTDRARFDQLAELSGNALGAGPTSDSYRGIPAFDEACIAWIRGMQPPLREAAAPGLNRLKLNVPDV